MIVEEVTNFKFKHNNSKKRRYYKQGSVQNQRKNLERRNLRLRFIRVKEEIFFSLFVVVV